MFFSQFFFVSLKSFVFFINANLIGKLLFMHMQLFRILLLLNFSAVCVFFCVCWCKCNYFLTLLLPLNGIVVFKGSNQVFFVWHAVRRDEELDQIEGYNGKDKPNILVNQKIEESNGLNILCFWMCQNLLTMKTSVNHLIPLELLGYHNDSNNSEQRRLWRRYDHDTNCSLPLQVDVHGIQALIHLYGWRFPKCPVQIENLVSINGKWNSILWINLNEFHRKW